MRDQTVGPADALSLALAEPDQHVRRRWILGLTLASLGMWMATQTPLQVMLALQLQDITPRHKIVALAVVTGVGAISSALATPIVGMLSDRTAHGRRIGRFSGRRHRWTLGMAVLAAACMVVLAEQATVFGVALLWFGFSAFQNGEYATLSAAIPDHVPVRQRATVSGWVGMPIALGLVLGTVLVVDVLDQRLVAGYVTLAVLMVLLALPFVLFTPDYPLAPHDREPFSWRRLASSYWLSPREYPDFGWAWLTRFLTSLAIAMGTLYLLYFLRDAVHYARLFPGQTAADGLLILILIYTGCVVLASIVGGVISDRRGRRKMLVTVSGLLMAAAALLLTFVETWDAALLRGGAVRPGLRRLHRGRPGADHAGAAGRQGPGQGPRHHQHRHRLPGRHRRADRRSPGLAGRLPGPVRGDRGGGRRGRDRGLEDQERQLTFPATVPSQDTTLSSSTTSAYFACRSNRADSCGPGSRSPTAWRTTSGTNPCCSASTAVARTQPLVLTPVMMTVSTPSAFSVAARVVPKKALAYCLTITISCSPGAICGMISPSGPPGTRWRSAGILRTNSPPLIPSWSYSTRVYSTGTAAARAAARTRAAEERHASEPM